MSARSAPHVPCLVHVILGALTLFMLALATLPAKAVEPDEVLQDPALEARARHISEGLRCLVCQNQSIDDSEAPLAKSARARTGTAEGRRYRPTDRGFHRCPLWEFVLLKPRLAPTPWCCGLPPRGLPHRTPDRHFGRSGAATPTALSDAEERRHFDLDGRNPSLAHGRIGARTCRF